MGYYTSYELELSDIGKTTEVVLALEERGIIGYALDENLETYDPVKWYSHSEDMKDISLKFQSVLFTLKGNGEEVWSI